MMCDDVLSYLSLTTVFFQSHTQFHATPLPEEDIQDGFTRPYRWHMDAPLYERLPGYVTSLISLKNPELPDQKIRFPSGEVLEIPAGATACKQR